MARKVTKLTNVTGDNAVSVVPEQEKDLDWYIGVSSVAGVGTLTVQYRIHEGSGWLEAGDDSVIDLTAPHGITLTGPVSGFNFVSSNGTDTYSVEIMQ